MKLLLLALIVTSTAIAAPNKIRLELSKAEVIAIKSAQLIEYKFKVTNPSHKVVHWHYEMQIKELQSELSDIITHEK